MFVCVLVFALWIRINVAVDAKSARAMATGVNSGIEAGFEGEEAGRGVSEELSVALGVKA